MLMETVDAPSPDGGHVTGGDAEMPLVPDEPETRSV
jgi:hypothetical protein